MEPLSADRDDNDSNNSSGGTGGMGGGTLFCVKAQVAAPDGMGGGIWRHLVLCKNTSGGTSPRLGLYNIKYNEVRACRSWGRAGKPSI